MSVAVDLSDRCRFRWNRSIQLVAIHTASGEWGEFIYAYTCIPTYIRVKILYMYVGFESCRNFWKHAIAVYESSNFNILAFKGQIPIV